MSSFPYVWDADGVPKGDARFYLALFGQAITGIACPFVSSVPTKVLTRFLGVIVKFPCVKFILDFLYYNRYHNTGLEKMNECWLPLLCHCLVLLGKS